VEGDFVAWFEDRSRCGYFGDQIADCLTAVGWLERGRAFTSGAVNADIYSKLLTLLNDPWQPGVSMGSHNCDLCLYEGQSGTKKLFIPASNFAFVCPELITHYMNAHGYRPPDEFCQTVLACPPMRSMPSMKALLAAARPLVKLANA
jgi:hypothetical protein